MVVERSPFIEAQPPVDTFYHPALERPEAIKNLASVLEREEFTNEDMFKTIADVSSVLSIERAIQDGFVEDFNFSFDHPDTDWSEGGDVDSPHFSYLGNGGQWIEFSLDKKVAGQEGPREEIALFEITDELDGSMERITEMSFVRDEEGLISSFRVVVEKDENVDLENLPDSIPEPYEMPQEDMKKFLNAMMKFYSDVPMPESLLEV